MIHTGKAIELHFIADQQHQSQISQVLSEGILIKFLSSSHFTSSNSKIFFGEGKNWRVSPTKGANAIVAAIFSEWSTTC